MLANSRENVRILAIRDIQRDKLTNASPFRGEIKYLSGEIEYFSGKFANK